MIFRLLLVAAAVAAAVVPLPSETIERWYSRAFYPRLQSVLTPASNAVPIALFDVAVIGILLGATVWLVRSRPWSAGRILLTAASAVAFVYLLFLLLWGFNYRRVRIQEKLAFTPAKITAEGATRLASDAVAALNATYARAHATAFDTASVARAVTDAQLALGDRRPFAPGVPKPSLLSWYFRQAAIDGMTDPFFLEVILNPDLLPFERPMVLAHEWAHLAGYAHEAEANFVAWLACRRGDPLSQYSAWLATYEHSAGALSRDERRRLPRLDEGPRGDLQAMEARYRRSAPAVRNAARGMNDAYLRANRVPEGIASYGAVLQLMLGVELDAAGTPRLRAR